MTDMRDVMLQTLDRIAEDTLTPAVRDDAERSMRRSDVVAGELCRPLWSALGEAGFFALGGTGGDDDVDFADAMALVRRAAYHALPLPMGETIIGRWLSSRAGLAAPEGAIGLATSPGPARLAGVASLADADYVTFTEGATAGSVLVAGLGERGQQLGLLRLLDTTIEVHANIAGEGRSGCRIGPVQYERMLAVDAPNAAADLYASGALLRSVQMAGALERVLDHCLLWANDRVQFGRPIAKFQAIQHQIAVLASEAAAAGAAADLAIEASAEGPDSFAIAIAKSRAGEAAGKAANIAHAVFGAMGFTREHELHYTTRRLWAWRNEFGSEVYWQAAIGRRVAESGGRKLWPMLNGEL